MSVDFNPPLDAVTADVAQALAEDIGDGDVTAALLPDIADSAYLLCKEDAVVCGRPWFDACHRTLDPDVRIAYSVVNDTGDERRLDNGCCAHGPGCPRYSNDRRQECGAD